MNGGNTHKGTLVVIGGGAAGFFCAINAARLNPNLRVVILEKSTKLLSKVKVSGGGRCNVTHACFDIDEMSRKYPRGTAFVKKMFHHFFTQDTIEWFRQRNITLKTEQDGRMFPETDSSQTIIQCLLDEAALYPIEIQLKQEVKTIVRKSAGLNVITAKGISVAADFICVACGGFPKENMFDWIKNLGHTIIPPVPSLFTFNIPQNDIVKLQGISNIVQLKIPGTKLIETGPLLVTHWGVSGPAVLRLSARAARLLAEKKYTFSILINWLPDYHEQKLRDHWNAIRNRFGSQKMNEKNPFDLPKRLWQYLLSKAGIHSDMYWSKLPAKQQNKLILVLIADEYLVKGKTTFKEEFVTCGGVQLSEIDFNTMMSKLVPRLFFAGEILDVDGITGGFNFQHAWSSGFIAAKAIAQSLYEM